ncbi:MAG: helix-turn-helix domain-containing protein [Candidatus Altiarchaeota archaeon]
MKKEELLTPEVFCPVRQTLKMLGKRWTLLIIKEIYYSKNKKLSFMELKRRLGNVSTKVLSERLKEMADDSLINRKEREDLTPARVYYTLTGKGKDVCKIIDEFKEYGRKWGGKKTFDCKDMDCELCFKLREEKKHPVWKPPSV